MTEKQKDLIFDITVPVVVLGLIAALLVLPFCSYIPLWVRWTVGILDLVLFLAGMMSMDTAGVDRL